MRVKHEIDGTSYEMDLPLLYWPNEEERLEFLHKVHDLKSLVKQLSAMKMFPQQLMTGTVFADRVQVLISIASILRDGEEIKVETEKPDSSGSDTSPTSSTESNTTDDGEHTPSSRGDEDRSGGS